MIWVDREAKKIKQRNLTLEWVDDMKTPSGRAHAGSLRTIVIHDIVYKALLDLKVNTKLTYFFDDHDPMDGMPVYLEKNKWQKYMGMQLYRIPSPEPGYKNFAEYYAKDFQSAFEKINCHPEIIWSSELYNSGRMNKVIKEILDNTDVIRKIYKIITKKEPQKDWTPFNPVCQNCNKVGTTKAYKWDGEFIYYRCIPDVVEWAKGCGYEGKVSPYNGKGKLPWKIEWAAKWKVIGITVEGAGKDHMTKGGSHDIASEICRKVLHYPVPYAFAYEFFTIGGKKMSSSKGAGISAKLLSEILPPDILRFLIVRTPIKSHLDFDPYADTLLNLFDDYDRCLNAYFLKIENKIPEKKAGEVALDFARIIELSEVKPLPKKRLYLPRFRTVANLIKANNKNLVSFFEQQKQEKLNIEEKEILEERIKYAKIYLENYAEEKNLTLDTKPPTVKTTQKQNEFLKILTKHLQNQNEVPQKIVFDSIKEAKIQPREAFTVFYNTLIGKPFGPKTGDLIKQLGKDEVVKLLGESVQTKDSNKTNLFPDLKDSKIFSISPEMAQKYPSLNIGIAIIKGVNIKKNNPELSKEIELFTKSQDGLNNEIISSYPEIQSYRKIYKEMGIDWHSKRPSPEALLRRIALKKGLYNINTCVDAYNLIVMKHRVSSGAFDLDQVKLQTVLRFPREGEEILLLGDDQPTKYKLIDLAYFDQIGGFNIYFNYRDAQRTAITEKTSNILLNIDGIFNITREQVELSLKENIEIITKYCGGNVEFAGIVSGKK